jgi:uncharacterized protein (DUF58 family)
MRTTTPNPNVQVSTQDLIGLRRRVEAVHLPASEPSRSALAGSHRSRFRGRGMDYQESRHYQPGDDIRNMDWRITARVGRPHVKLYEEERERPVITLVDFSPSMFFGTRGAFKSVTAARLAAIIAWAAIVRGDRIGAILFGYGSGARATFAQGAATVGHHELPPAGGRRAALRLIRDLALAGNLPATTGGPGGPPSPGPEAAGALSAALGRLRRVSRPGGLTFIISDFYSMDTETSRHLGLLRRHGEVVACQVSDALELAPPPPGRYGIGDGRRSGILDMGPALARERYTDYFARHHAAVAALTGAHSIPLIRLSPEDDPVAHLAAGLGLRLGRTRRAQGGQRRGASA